jgi:hypothetical protein
MPQTGSIAMLTMVAAPMRAPLARPWYDTGVRSVEWAVMRSPARAYEALTASSPEPQLLSTIGRPIVAAMVIGAAMTVSASDSLDGAFPRATIAWSFAVVLQAVAGLVLIASAPEPRVSRGRALDLLFAANGPWMLWLAGFTLWTELTPVFGRPVHTALWSLLVPGAWTALLMYRYCRSVLGVTGAGARRRTILHQSATWLLFAAYFFWAVQGWPRVIGILAGWRS